MKQVKIFYCIIIIVVVSTSCSKKKPGTEYIPDNLKQYSIFQLGSYWIFKNEKTGILDSSFIESPPHYYIYKNQDPLIADEQYCELRYGGSFISITKINPDYYSIEFKNGFSGNCLYSISFHPGYTIDNDHTHPFTNLGYFDSLVVNNGTFFNVMNTRDQQLTNNYDTITGTYYLAKSIGLIKFQLGKNHTDTTWSLLRYHVVL